MKSLILSLSCIVFTSLLQAQVQSFASAGISGGSALLQPSFNPYDSLNIYMVSDLTGIFYTEDGGITWDVIPFQELKGTTQSRIYFTSHPDTLYTIHNDFRNVKQYVYRSDNGGDNWHPIDNDPANGETVYLYVDPDRTNRLLVTDGERIYFSQDKGLSFNQVYQSTNSLYIGGVFWDEEDIYLGCNDGLLVSENGGNSFDLQTVQGIEPDQGFLSLTGTKTENGVRLFCAIRHMYDMWSGMLPSGSNYYGQQKLYFIERDFNNGFISDNIHHNLETFIDFPFYTDRPLTNSTIIYSAGAKATNTGSIHPQVYKKTSGTSGWTPVLQTEQNQNIATGYMGEGGDLEWTWSENAMGFGFNPNDAEVAIVSDFSFAHITRDGGASWQALYVLPEDLNSPGMTTPQKKSYRTNGLENTSCWWLTWTDADQLFAGYTDITAIRSEDGGEHWSFDYEGLDYTDIEKYNSIYHISSHPNGHLYASASTIHDIYQSTYLTDDALDNGSGALLVSPDNGKNWSMVHDFEHPLIWSAIDLSNPEIMYVSVISSQSGGIFKTENLSAGINASWQQLTSPPRTEGHPFNIRVINGDTIVCSYSGRRYNGLFTASSGVFYSDDGGQNWKDRSASNMIYWTKDIIVNHHDPKLNTWYACVFDGFSSHPATVGTGGLYRTSDRGISWQEVGDFFRVESVTVHPTNPEVMYVTTEDEGLWFTDNLSDLNPDFIQLESYPFQQPTRVFFNPHNIKEVWVASFGNGLRKGIDDTSVSVLTEEYSLPTIDAFPIPTQSELFVHTKGIQGYSILKLFDLHGRCLLKKAIPDQGTVLDVSAISPGIYILSLEKNGKSLCRNKIVIL